MNTRRSSDIWIFNCAIVLGLIAAASVVGTLILTIMGQPLSDVVTWPGILAAAGLGRLLISPFNQSRAD